MTLSRSLWCLCWLLLMSSFIHFYLFQVMSMLDPKTIDMFYFTGPKHTTPNCPIDLKPDLNPSTGARSYEGSDEDCSKNALYNIPFFLENLGPRFSEWSVNAHESRPGHHTQVRKTAPCPTLARWEGSLLFCVHVAKCLPDGNYARNPNLMKGSSLAEGDI